MHLRKTKCLKENGCEKGRLGGRHVNKDAHTESRVRHGGGSGWRTGKSV